MGSSVLPDRYPPILGFYDRRALYDAGPLIPAAVPFAFVVGLSCTKSAMPTWVAWSTSPLVFAGASQLALITLAGTATLWAVITAAIVINTRHVMYSAALAPVFRHQPRWMRIFAPFLLVDQVFALSILRRDDPPESFRRYYLSLGITFYLFWLPLTAIGMVVGPIVPESWQLSVAPTIMFCGIVLMGIKKVPEGVAAVTSALVGLASSGLSDRLGILVGGFAGIIAGVIAEMIIENRQSKNPRAVETLAATSSETELS